ncbi:MAG: hypothetical protein IT529_05805 [Burkholderiales bacterium]|nr:hypothetical protein [Burkholderiales bacterium]
MTEYLIILALIAIAAAGTLAYFGRGTTREPPVDTAGDAGTAAGRAPAGAPARTAVPKSASRAPDGTRGTSSDK